MLLRAKIMVKNLLFPAPVAPPPPPPAPPAITDAERTAKARIEDFPRDLHLGCGGRRAPGMCNVDITAQSTVDITDNVMTLERFPDNYASSIYACHVLEHFSHAEAPEVLKNWFRVLAPGGTIRVSVPDIDRIVKIYVKNWDHFQKDGHSPWVGLLYGGQTDQYDYHKTGWNFCWMAHIMRGIGYVDCQEYPHQPHFLGADFWDNSLAHEPFGEFLSLNMLAKKPV
jgi:SAM-dependent methyltransferase